MRLDELKKVIIDYKNALSCIEYLKFKNQYSAPDNSLIVKMFNKTISDNSKIIEKKKEYLIIPAKTLEKYIQEEFRRVYPNDDVHLYYTENIVTHEYQAGTDIYVENEYYHRLMLAHTSANKHSSITLHPSKEFSPLSKAKCALIKKVNIADIIRIESNEIDKLINQACWNAVVNQIENKFSISNVDDTISI